MGLLVENFYPKYSQRIVLNHVEGWREQANQGSISFF
jgi:hypothetical protein